jgi:hypothetical protein
MGKLTFLLLALFLVAPEPLREMPGKLGKPAGAFTTGSF